uniref:Uncharacterized protein n=1 Tax=Amphimedon queenslandica TaxID=400682 RepID=A0A1X7UL33_AMPQE
MRSKHNHRAIDSSQKVPVIFCTPDATVVKYMKLLTPYAFMYFSLQLALNGKVSHKTSDLSLRANDTNEIYEVTFFRGIRHNVA